MSAFSTASTSRSRHSAGDRVERLRRRRPWLVGNGDGSFQPALNFPAGEWPEELVTADVNGDGSEDILVSDRGPLSQPTARSAYSTASPTRTVAMSVRSFSGAFSATTGKLAKNAVTVLRQPSKESRLRDLTVSPAALAPGFDPDTTTYDGGVIATLKLNVTAARREAHALGRARVNGGAFKNLTKRGPTRLTLTGGTNTLEVQVTAEDKAHVTSYTVTLHAIGITKLAPSQTSIGTAVKIAGFGFDGATAVKFNGTDAQSFTVDSSKRITAVIAPGTSTGPVTVASPTGTATSSTLLTIK